MARCLAIVGACLVLAGICAGQANPPKQDQTQTIEGKVVDVKTGQPIRKVNVQLIGVAVQGNSQHTATTGADGTFNIDGLKPGRYAVNLERAGYVQTTIRRRPGMLTLPPGQSLTGLVFQMQAAGVISGKIVDLDGDPMAGVSVTATAASATAMERYAYTGAGGTNDLGEYRISDLKAGKYLVVAAPSQREAGVKDNGPAKERLIYASTYYPGTMDRSQAIAVEVHAGEEATANFGVLTTHAYRVSGAVTGVPSGAMVRFFLTSTTAAAEGEPKELTEGNRFECQNVLPGTYVAIMFAVKGMFNGAQPDVQVIRLSPTIEVDKSDVEGLQLHPEPTGEIRGKFRLDTGEKFDWTQLSVNPLPIGENASQIPMGVALGAAQFGQAAPNSGVSSDGTFAIKSVPSGTYQLLIGARSDTLRDYYTKSVLFGGRDVADSGFAVSGDVELEVVVSAKGGAVEGKVVDSKGQPAPYAMVTVVPNSQNRARPDSYQQDTADEHGHFMVRGLNPGSYVVLAFEELQEDVRQPDFLKKNRAKGETIDVQAGERKNVTAKIIPAEAP